MEERTISTVAGWGKYRLTIDGVKAYVCPNCGEIVFSAEEVHMLQELGKEGNLEYCYFFEKLNRA
jgi:YgiT-type zinc finger domain-containing protein